MAVDGTQVVGPATPVKPSDSAAVSSTRGAGS